MAFDDSPDVHTERDEEGHVRVLQHRAEPFTAGAARLGAPSARELADEYVRQVADLYDITPDEIADLQRTALAEPAEEGPRLTFSEEKAALDMTVVSYAQTFLGLPVWQAALEVRLYGEPLRVASSDSVLHYDLDAVLPAGDSPADWGDRKTVSRALGLDEETAGRLSINGTRLLVYRYVPEDRSDSTAGGEPGLDGGPPTLPLPTVPPTIVAKRHYVVHEVLFSLPLPGWEELHWRAFVEPGTSTVLYLRALAASATGCVFVTDPVSASGVALTGCSPAATLDPLRATVALPGLDPPASGVQALRGTYVALTDTDAPAVAAPTTTDPFSFCYSAVTNDFAAVNAYYHYDGAYRLLESMGFDIKSYFDGTAFPVPVDHQGFGTSVNAQAAGNPSGTGMGRFRNGLATAGCSVGIAADARVVLHEFGHALLWDHVGSPNFGWCHSAGDALAAILHDPSSQAPDRFATFPYIGLDRRHDRALAAGFAWGGNRDDRQYGSEQILSTTLFRVYRSAGGDDADVTIKRFAARYLAFLIVKAIGALTVTTNDPRVYVSALIDADVSTADFEGHRGGAWHKALRWSFERQGLYQPAGAPRPVTQPGAPPAVDVYIDDGRAGAYLPYQDNLFACPDIWNRRAPDGGTAHQEPTVGWTNYTYVRVKNRGTQAATDVGVELFQADPAAGLAWPTGWIATTTARSSVPTPWHRTETPWSVRSPGHPAPQATSGCSPVPPHRVTRATRTR